MPNYKELYSKMFRATEEAVELLIPAQQNCEELYSSSSEQKPQVILLPTNNKKE